MIIPKNVLADMNVGKGDAACLTANTRAAFVALAAYLELNGWALIATDADCVTVTLRLAAGHLTEDALAAWIRAHAERP